MKKQESKGSATCVLQQVFLCRTKVILLAFVGYDRNYAALDI